MVQLIQNLDIIITDRDVMLLYSAGKDGTLAALRKFGWLLFWLWESKCLIGKEAKEKTEEDEQRIHQYYKTIIEPIMEKRLNRIKRIWFSEKKK